MVPWYFSVVKLEGLFFGDFWQKYTNCYSDVTPIGPKTGPPKDLTHTFITPPSFLSCVI